MAGNKTKKSRSSPLRRLFSVRNRIAHGGLRIAGVTPLLATRPPDAIPYSALEMARLFYDMRTRRPLTVMEFGVGCSTITIAAALAKNGRGKLVTVDGSEHWIAVCRDSLPESLRHHVEFIYSPVEVIESGKAHRYMSIPPVAVDYLFIDGPSPQHIPGWQGRPVAADPLVGMTFNPGARIMVEGRPGTAEYLRDRLDASWTMKKDRIFAFSWTMFDKQA